MTPALIDRHTFDALQATAGADFVAELVDTFGEEARTLIDDMRKALIDASAERLRFAAHSLKSNGLTFGATRLADKARALELGLQAADAAAVDALAAEFHATLRALQALARS